MGRQIYVDFKTGILLKVQGSGLRVKKDNYGRYEKYY
jgi:predicted phage gp36 major capsid-like protein